MPAVNESSKYTHFSNVEIGSATGGGGLRVGGSTIVGSGLNTRVLEFDVTLGTADDQHIVIPFAATVSSVYSVIHGALATANETLTFKNNAGTAMTGGVITITQVGSADGDIDSATPSANNTFAAGEKMTVSIGGENTNAVVARITVVVTLS